MTVKELASEIARREGKRTQARIGEVREIVGIIADLCWTNPETQLLLSTLGAKRAKRNNHVSKL